MLSDHYRQMTPDDSLRRTIATLLPDDWAEFERTILLEDGMSAHQPRYSRLGVAYTRIPFELRARLNRWRISRMTRNEGPPDLDRMRQDAWRASAEQAGVELREPTTRRLVLTHDVDEDMALPGVESLLAVESDLGLVSAWGVLSKRYALDESTLHDLIGAGHEVYSHGYLHDGTDPYVSPAEIRARLQHFFEVYPSVAGHVRGFRSGQLARSPRLFDAVADVFDFDLTPPTVEVGGPHGWRTGCGSAHPFTRDDGLPHLPLSLPQDYFLVFIDRLDLRAVVDEWLRAATEVWRTGGVAVLLVHPDNVVRRSWLADAYRDFLQRVLESGVEVLLPHQVVAELPRREPSADEG